ncbi:MAG: hypothetical protein UZ02_AOB001000297, partial [Nitrosomonas europaea]
QPRPDFDHSITAHRVNDMNDCCDDRSINQKMLTEAFAGGMPHISLPDRF